MVPPFQKSESCVNSGKVRDLAPSGGILAFYMMTIGSARKLEVEPEIFYTNALTRLDPGK